MRNLVEPLPSTHCEHCNGELLFKRIETDDPALDIEVQIFVCAECGHEQSHTVTHDPYAAHTAGSMPPDKVGQQGGSGSNRPA